MRTVIFAFTLLMAVTAWAIDQSTPQVKDVVFPVDRHTAGAMDTKNAKEGQILVQDSLKGRSVEDFLTPDGRFDLKAIRASGYQGPLDLKEFDMRMEPHSGEPILSPYANARIFSHPDDTFWTDKFSNVAGLACVAGLSEGDCSALCVYDGKLIAGGDFQVANCTLATYIASWDGSSWPPLGSGMNDVVKALTVYDNKLIAGGWFTTAGGDSANRIASWDGSSWSPLGSGMNNAVSALAVYDNKLIAGGDFTTAGGDSAKYIASWDGSS
jgi:hypothetical protein